MSEFHIGTSEKLIFSANALRNHYGSNDEDAMRMICYLSLLACEIALKAALEKAGLPISQIENRRHNLAGLLDDLGRHCKIEKGIVDGLRAWVPATDIRGKTIEDSNGAQITVGKLLDDTAQHTSRYPNEIRYGNSIQHYPPEVVLDAATKVVEWVNNHWENMRLKTKLQQNLSTSTPQP